jgi:site-specific recombinase XerD
MKLLDQVRHIIRKKHYSIRTEQAYTDWIKRFILFHGKRHPKDMGETEISQYISYLAVKKNVAASTQNQALNAIVFLYKQVLKRELGDFGNMERAKRPKRLPTVLTKDEANLVLTVMSGTNALMAKMLYGCGLRLMECLRLRVKDVSTTMIYTHVLNKGGMGVKSPLDMISRSDFQSAIRKQSLTHEVYAYKN